MIAGAVARRYAKAILELGNELGTLDAIVEEITAAGDAYKSSADLRAVLDNPLFPLEVKRNVINEVAQTLGVSQTTRNTLQLLNDRRRMPALPGIAQLLREMADLRKGVLRAEVVTATVLSDAYYTKLQVQLEKMTGKRVIVDRREDPSIIAGVVTRIGDTVYDGSLRARLDEMKHALLPQT